MMSKNMSAPDPSVTSIAGSGQDEDGISFAAFVTALVSSLVVFATQMSTFILLKDKLPRIL